MPNNAILSRTEIEQTVRATIAERVSCSISQAHTARRLREDLGFDAEDIWHILALLEHALLVDLNEARSIAWQRNATIGHVVDCIEGAMKAGGVNS